MAQESTKRERKLLEALQIAIDGLEKAESALTNCGVFGHAMEASKAVTAIRILADEARVL